MIYRACNFKMNNAKFGRDSEEKAQKVRGVCVEFTDYFRYAASDRPDFSVGLA